jgi:hypothetical protein
MKAGTMMRTIRIPAVDSRNHALPVRCRIAGGTQTRLKSVNMVRPLGMGRQGLTPRHERLLQEVQFLKLEMEGAT